METTRDKRDLYRDACTVVAHFGREIERTFTELRNASHAVPPEALSAMMATPCRFAQVLGDLMNGADMALDEDDWCDDVFHRINEFMASRP